jgi:hypothetical protein
MDTTVPATARSSRGQNDGHAVVYRSDDLVSLRRQDRARLDDTFIAFPPVPQPGEAERPSVAQVKVKGLPDPIEITEGMDFEVWGRVMWSLHRH